MPRFGGQPRNNRARSGGQPRNNQATAVPLHGQFYAGEGISAWTAGTIVRGIVQQEVARDSGLFGVPGPGNHHMGTPEAVTVGLPTCMLIGNPLANTECRQTTVPTHRFNEVYPTTGPLVGEWC